MPNVNADQKPSDTQDTPTTVQKQVCLKCKKPEQRTRVITPTGRYYYVDQNGAHWSGGNCPSCKNKKYKRWKKLSVKGEFVRASKLRGKELRNNQPVRFCRDCKRKLPADKYFYHVHCGPRTEYLDWATVGAIPSIGDIVRRRG